MLSENAMPPHAGIILCAGHVAGLRGGVRDRAERHAEQDDLTERAAR
jgi:hypothetical protein